MNVDPLPEQKYLKHGGLIVFLAWLSAFIPLSTDLYLPALPGMGEALDASSTLVNLTLILFFLFYALSSLVWGGISDRYGRKPVILTGLVGYTISSFLCAFSGSIETLIFFRILQAIGAGAVIAVSMAIVKDSFSGRKRETVLATVQTMVTIAPIVAPVLGAQILRFTSWRGPFWALALIGVLASIVGLLYQETNLKRHDGSVFYSISRIGVVSKNMNFTLMVLVFSMVFIPFMGFISASSFIFINDFGLSEERFSYFFAMNALFSMMGPVLYIQLSRRIPRAWLITAGFVVIILSGISLHEVGPSDPWSFIISLIPATLAIGIIRPPGTNLMLDQEPEHTGSASSAISFAMTLSGSIGMILLSQEGIDRIRLLGLLYAVVAGVSLLLWFWVWWRNPGSVRMSTGIHEAGSLEV